MVYLKYHNVKYYFYHAQIQYNYLSSFTFKKMFCQNRTQLVPHQIECVTTFTNFHSQNKIAFVFLIIFYAKINNALHLINFVIGDKTLLSTNTVPLLLKPQSPFITTMKSLSSSCPSIKPATCVFSFQVSRLNI